MARAIWSGTISFGLVSVPVKLFPATEQRDIRFHQFKKGTDQRIRNKRVAESSGREVDYDDIVKGYEVDKDTLRSCIVPPGKDRPTEFVTKSGSGIYLFSYKRAKP